MTEQEKLAKVIEGLLVQIHRIEHTQRQIATNGAAMFPHIKVEALYDALALLEAQMSRVLGFDIADKRYMILRMLEQNIKDYPYLLNPPTYSRDTLKEIRDLLKAQEPRVMTMEEIENESEPEPVVYVEIRHGNDSQMFYGVWIDDAYEMSDGSILLPDDMKFNGDVWKEYGQTIRRWTSRPTDAQREAVKWG